MKKIKKTSIRKYGKITKCEMLYRMHTPLYVLIKRFEKHYSQISYKINSPFRLDALVSF